MWRAVRGVVELVHAPVSHVIHVASPDRHEQRGREQDERGDGEREEKAASEHPCRDGLEHEIARRVTTEVRVVHDVLHGIKHGHVLALAGELVAQRRVLLHVVVELVLLALLQKPAFVLARLNDGVVRDVQDVCPGENKTHKPQSKAQRQDTHGCGLGLAIAWPFALHVAARATVLYTPPAGCLQNQPPSVFGASI